MDSVLRYINEAESSTKWAAIRITTKGDDSWQKETTTERVVTYDTYCEMKSKGRTKGYMTIKYLELLGTGNSREIAEEYITPKDKKKRKGKLKTDGYDLVCWAIPCGKIQANGNTKFGWNLWENSKDNEDQYIYIASDSETPHVYSCSFIYAHKTTFETGEKVLGIDNDSQKKLSGFAKTICGGCHCDLESFQELVRDILPNECKQPKRAFGRVSDGLPWSKFGQVYSCKGTIEAEKYNDLK